MEDACVRCWRTRSLRWRKISLLPPSVSRVLFLSSVPLLCPDITRQKYCDWSTIEYDVTWPRSSRPRWRQWSLGSDVRLLNQANRESLFFLQKKKERERERGETEGEVKNMIFSLLDARRVSGISYGSRAQWPCLFGMLGKTFLTIMKLDVWNSKRGENMPAYNTRLLLFSLKIIFVICNVEFRWFLYDSEPLARR